MKTKFILPLVVAAAFVACSDDSSSTAPVNPDPALSSDALPTDLGSSSDMAVIDPTSSSDMLPPELSSSSVGGIDPIPPAVDGPYDPTKKYTFYGAELTGKEQFLYGRFEARMKMAATSGSVSSMFLNYDRKRFTNSVSTRRMNFICMQSSGLRITWPGKSTA